jgi:hypothetical protein
MEKPTKTWGFVFDDFSISDILLAMAEMWELDGLLFNDAQETIAWIDDVDAGRSSGQLPELMMLAHNIFLKATPVAHRLRQSPKLRNTAIVLATLYRLNPTEKRQLIKDTDADLLIYLPFPKFSVLQGMLEEAIAKRKDKHSPAQTG